MFHCWKARRGWDLTINSRTPKIDYRRIYSLWIRQVHGHIEESGRTSFLRYVYSIEQRATNDYSAHLITGRAPRTVKVFNPSGKAPDEISATHRSSHTAIFISFGQMHWSSSYATYWISSFAGWHSTKRLILASFLGHDFSAGLSTYRLEHCNKAMHVSNVSLCKNRLTWMKIKIAFALFPVSHESRCICSAWSSYSCSRRRHGGPCTFWCSCLAHELSSLE
jgi:hypothetical protein